MWLISYVIFSIKRRFSYAQLLSDGQLEYPFTLLALTSFPGVERVSACRTMVSEYLLLSYNNFIWKEKAWYITRSSNCDLFIWDYLQMNRLSLRNNRLEFKTAGKLSIFLEEFIEYTPI